MRSRADASPAFLFAPCLAAAGEALELPERERHHLFHVCRARAGDTAIVTDGAGGRARIVVHGAGRGASVVVEDVEQVPRGRRAWLACGAPEGARTDWLVEKLAELGLERFQPVHCARGRWPAARSRGKRLERLALAALKQSRQCHLMTVADAMSLDAFLDAVPPDAVRWVADARGAGAERVATGSLWVGLSGPAGGFNEDESARLAAGGYSRVRLAAATLRAETAAVAMAALWASGVDHGRIPA